MYKCVHIYIYKHLKNDRPTSSLFLTSGNSWGAQTTHASVPRATTRSVADTTVMALPLSSVMVRLDTPGSGAPSQRDVYLHRWKTGKPAGNHGFFACFFFSRFCSRFLRILATPTDRCFKTEPLIDIRSFLACPLHQSTR